jgi:hypothetical protein
MGSLKQYVNTTMAVNAQSQKGVGKILAAYFSWNGNPEAFVRQIAGETNGGLL